MSSSCRLPIKKRSVMKKIIFCFILCLFLFQANAMSAGKDSLDLSIPAYKYHRPKYLHGLKQDTLHYMLPTLTLHLGGSYGISNGTATINSVLGPGTKVDFQDDLGFPSGAFFPRFNFIIAFTQ